MIELFDTHFHFKADSDAAVFMQELPATDYKFTLLAAASDYADSLAMQNLAAKYDNVYFTCGVHPHEAAAENLDLEAFSGFKAVAKLKAIGEIGLDYFYDFCPRHKQLPVFEFFLDLALQWQLPAVIHLRDRDNVFTAYEDAYERLKIFAAKGGKFDIHCFSATPEWAEKFLQLGGFLGVTGMVTFKKSTNIREALKHIPTERLLLETDSPYLAPIPYRGKENHPKYLVEIAKFVAQEKGLTLAELTQIVTCNSKKFFNIES